MSKCNGHRALQADKKDEYSLATLLCRHVALWLRSKLANTRISDIARHIWNLPRRAAVECITLYQATLSPDHGPLKDLHPYGFCRHHPTCSEYAKQQIASRGCVIGSVLAIKRILSCTPWHTPSRNTERKNSYIRQ